MKSKTWLILLVLTVALLLVFSGQSASGYFNDAESSTDNVLRIGIINTSSLLLSADNFTVLASSTITNTGATIVNGDLGLSPGTSVVGFPPGTVNGTMHVTDAIAAQAQIDLTAASTNLTGRPFNVDLTGQDLGSLTLTPGIYKFSTAAQLTGTLILDATGNSSGLFIFQIGSTLTTAGSSIVSLVNANAANVYWVVDTATLGIGTVFVGNILAFTTITLNTGVTLEGRALASNGAVTLDANTITKPVP